MTRKLRRKTTPWPCLTPHRCSEEGTTATSPPGSSPRACRRCRTSSRPSPPKQRRRLRRRSQSHVRDPYVLVTDCGTHYMLEGWMTFRPLRSHSLEGQWLYFVLWGLRRTTLKGWMSKNKTRYLAFKKLVVSCRSVFFFFLKVDSLYLVYLGSF